MSGGKLIQIKAIFILWTCCLLFVQASFAYAKPVACNTVIQNPHPLSKEALIAKQLGWVNADNRCDGYYVEEPFLYPDSYLKNDLIKITSDQVLFAKHGTSFWQGRVTITRYAQEITANKAYLYRDPVTGDSSSIELVDDVNLREPNSLIIAKNGRYNLKDKSQTLHDILYRTAIYSNWNTSPVTPSNKELQTHRHVTQLSAWGKASEFSQSKPKVFEFSKVSYSTCPPTTNAWKVEASHLELNKETGRGVARNARLLVKGVPIYYTPYLNFPIDHRRQTGFLPPTFGGAFSQSGPAFAAPFYWNMAPNYDMTITPIYLSKRGIQVNDLYRYLTPHSYGNIRVGVLPNDREFAAFQDAAPGRASAGEYGPLNDPITTPILYSKLRRLENASTTRKSLVWVDTRRFNEHWSSDVNVNYVSDDYYLRDLSANLDQVTKNQLLQQGEIDYAGQNWNFIGRVQAYQTLHPLDDIVVYQNAYTRAPQLVLNGDYPDQAGGFEYFIGNDLSRFDIRKNPGESTKMPIGSRYNTQPGISRPINFPYMSITPRVQFAATKYQLGDVLNREPSTPSRTLPIFDLNSSFYFDRNTRFFQKNYRQTLEPQLYYVYIPYRNQNDLPLFDTTANSLTYDQLFLYNRFSGLDRINDANRLSTAITTRFIDQQTGYEKIRAGLGQIFYFANRRVSLCSHTLAALCPDDRIEKPENKEDSRTRSPLTGMLQYNVSPDWSAIANTIWNPQKNQVDNQSITLHFQPASNTQKILNLGYNYVRAGDIFPSDKPDDPSSNLSSTDLSFNWPITRDWSFLGRWTQNWNHHHFQNLLFGLQYDSCCWAVRFVAGRFYTHLSANETFQYNPQLFVQFALKGLGNIGTGDPSQVLSTNVSGYPTNFGQDF